MLALAGMDHFFSLTPDRILDSVEDAIGSKKTGVRATGRTFQLNSMENRVYEIELDDESRVVGKFYRPGRWSKDCILEEHEFIRELAAGEVPAVAPIELSNQSTLFETSDGIFFALFPKVRGQIVQELADTELAQIGRLLARLHNVGAAKQAKHRLSLNPKTYGQASLDFLKSGNFIDIQVLTAYTAAVNELLQKIEPMFQDLPIHRVHGDCHLGNVLWHHTPQGAQAFFLDFDDMVTGPAVQDIWLVVRGRDETAQRQRQVLIESYQTLRSFDIQTLRLIEPLRALRMIHYSAWIARRWNDPIFQRTFPEFGSYRYWQDQLADVHEQLRFIAN